jgi:hypothetical protein
VFKSELKGDREEGARWAKSVFDNAISELDTLSEDSYHDSTLVMQ